LKLNFVQCFSTSSEETEEYSTTLDDGNDGVISKGQCLTIIPKKENTQVCQETENSEQLKDTVN